MNNNVDNQSMPNDWRNNFVTEILDITKTSIKSWCDIVVNLGADENVREKWCNTFIEQVKTSYNDLIDDVNEQQTRFIKKIEAALEKSSELCMLLQIKIPQFGAEKLSLKQEYIALTEKIYELEQQVNERKTDINSINKQQLRLCNLLGREPKIIPDSPLPSEEFLNTIRNFIETLENERFKRSEHFIEVKASILEIAEALEYEANLDFEKLVLSQNDIEFLLTDNNLDLLDKFLVRLQTLQHTTTQEIGDLKEKLGNLWTVLNEDLKTRADFLEMHSQNSLSNLKAMQEELQRLNQLRKNNIEMFLKSLREKLISMWNQCHYTAEQRTEFEYFHTDCYTEDLLTLHDLEIQRLKNFYSNNQELFNLLEKWHNMKTELSKLEERASAPDRLKNRGGQLLKEERNRNVLTKQIPIIEVKLINLSEQFEEKEGYQFTSWGSSVQKLIDEDHKNREEERFQKLSARKRDKTPTPATSTLALSTITSGNTMGKRKIFQTPDKSIKKLRVLTESNHVPKTVIPKLQTNGKQYASSADRIKSKYKLKRLSFKSQQMKEACKENNATGAEYTEFEKYMENKNDCRSTVFLNNDIHADSTDDLIEFPATPNLPKVPSSCTPRTVGKSKDCFRTPLTASKFASSSSNLNF